MGTVSYNPTPRAQGAVGGGRVVTVTASRVLESSDNGAVLLCNSATTMYLTDPGTLGAGFSCGIVQIGAGVVKVIGAVDSSTITSPASGTYLVKGTLVGSVFGSGLVPMNVQTILTAIGATVWLPGIGTMNFGFTNSSYSDTANTTLAVADGTVKSLRASRNTSSTATVLTPTGAVGTTPPTLKLAASGAYYLEFPSANADGFLMTPQPFVNRIDPMMMMAVAGLTASNNRVLLSLRNRTAGSSDRMCLETTASNYFQSRGNGYTITSAVAIGAQPQVLTFRQSAANARNLRQDGVQTQTNTQIATTFAVSNLVGQSLGGDITTSLLLESGGQWRGPVYAIITSSGANACPSDDDTLILERFFGSLAGITIA